MYKVTCGGRAGASPEWTVPTAPGVCALGWVKCKEWNFTINFFLFFLQNRYPIMVKCLNIGENIGKPIYRPISSYLGESAQRKALREGTAGIEEWDGGVGGGGEGEGCFKSPSTLQPHSRLCPQNGQRRREQGRRVRERKRVVQSECCG